MIKIREILNVPDTKYTSMQIARWLWRSWKGNRTQAALNALLGMMRVVASLVQVWAVKHAVDVASGSTAGRIRDALLILAGLILVDFALNISGIWIRNILGIRARNRMQRLMLHRVLGSEWRGRNARHSGDIVNRIEFDVGTVIAFLTETIPGTLSVLALFVGAFTYLFTLDCWLALITVAIIPVFAIGSKLYVVKMRHLTRLVRDADSRVQSVLQEAVQHRMLIKTLETRDSTVEKLGDAQRELRRNVVKRTLCSVSSNFVLNSGFALGYLLAFFWAAVRMSAGTLTFGGMTAFLQLVSKIQGPARSLTKLVPSFVNVATAVERLIELEDVPLEEEGNPQRVAPPCGIRLNDISFAYSPDERRIIDHLSFDFVPGSCTAILGETGSGKTTLVRLMLALIRPTRGRIEIYGNDSTRELSPLTRCNFVYVPQGNTLMSGTIRDNLLMGNADVTETQMLAALEKSCATFVTELPQGIDTPCSEQGGGLSEGQAQRIAIARALLRDRPVMLLDEATSALDMDTERRLLANILSDKTKTVIFITHRQAVTEYCDMTLTVGAR